jgi:hypothetical protein
VAATPDGEPFFAATYLPPDSLPGRIGVKDLASQVKEFWATQRKDALEAAGNLTGQLADLESRLSGAPQPADELDLPLLLEQALLALESRFDPEHGGFGQSPKFPTPPLLTFLLRAHHASADPKALHMLETTLHAMRAGGIWDHLGLGFHRYSTDSRWLLPHFEKMLYDQALLASVYLEAFQATGDQTHARTAEEIFDFVRREMTSPEGAFYSGLDADSEGEEGKFYVWTSREVREVLGEDDAAVFLDLYGFEEGGNFNDEATGRRTGANIPHLREPLENGAQRLGRDPQELQAELARMRSALLERRNRRVRPLTDDKVLTDWNGLMIAALACGSRVLDDPELARRARTAADFILERLRDEHGQLLRRHRHGESAHSGQASDYAYFLLGLTELLQTEAGADLEDTALELARDFLERFRDPDTGGFFTTASDAKSLLVRQKDFFDGAQPSANSAAALALIRLGHLAGSVELAEAGAAVVSAVGGQITRNPLASPLLVSALALHRMGMKTATIRGPGDDPAVREMLAALASTHLPGVLVKREPAGEPGAEVCEMDRCLAPVSNARELLERTGDPA